MLMSSNIAQLNLYFVAFLEEMYQHWAYGSMLQFWLQTALVKQLADCLTGQKSSKQLTDEQLTVNIYSILFSKDICEY